LAVSGFFWTQKKIKNKKYSIFSNAWFFLPFWTGGGSENYQKIVFSQVFERFCISARDESEKKIISSVWPFQLFWTGDKAENQHFLNFAFWTGTKVKKSFFRTCGCFCIFGQGTKVKKTAFL